VTKAAVQAEYRVNGGNQRDTGHWIWSAPPAAMADDPSVMVAARRPFCAGSGDSGWDREWRSLN